MSMVGEVMALEKENAELRKELEQVKTHCEIRERALYKIRRIVKSGSEISKIAGKALCYGNYTRKWTP
jgi:hypothetical protein